MRNLQADLAPGDVNTASLTDVGAEVSAKQPPLTDSEVLAEFFETGNISDIYDEVMDASDGLEGESMKCSGKFDLLLALQDIQKL